MIDIVLHPLFVGTLSACAAAIIAFDLGWSGGMVKGRLIGIAEERAERVARAEREPVNETSYVPNGEIW